jgi:hypothetical protein
MHGPQHIASTARRSRSTDCISDLELIHSAMATFWIGSDIETLI